MESIVTLPILTERNKIMTYRNGEEVVIVLPDSVSNSEMLLAREQSRILLENARVLTEAQWNNYPAKHLYRGGRLC